MFVFILLDFTPQNIKGFKQFFQIGENEPISNEINQNALPQK